MPKRTLGQELIKAMEEVVAYRKGSKKLKERVVVVTPESVHVDASSHNTGLPTRLDGPSQVL